MHRASRSNVKESMKKKVEENIEIVPIIDRESLIAHTLWMFNKVQNSLEIF